MIADVSIITTSQHVCISILTHKPMVHAPYLSELLIIDNHQIAGSVVTSYEYTLSKHDHTVPSPMPLDKCFVDALLDSKCLSWLGKRVMAHKKTLIFIFKFMTFFQHSLHQLYY